MFDTMTMTKAVGAVCGSLLVFLLVGWAGSSLFTVGGGHGGGHEGEEIAQAYTIDTGEAAAPEDGAAEGPDFARPCSRNAPRATSLTEPMASDRT
jgi:cytochrome c